MLLSQALNPRAEATWSPLDDRWYTSDITTMGDAGVAVSGETILRCSTVLAAVRWKAEAFASTVPYVREDLGNGRKKDTPDHYAQVLLLNPNTWQTWFEWAHLQGLRLTIWGNSPNIIRDGKARMELWPTNPWTFRLVGQRSDGGLTYEYTDERGEKKTVQQEKVLHFRGLSTDGMMGSPTYQLIRNAVSIALAAERHQGTFLRKGSRLSGLLVPAAPLNKEQGKELRESVNVDLGGSSNTGTFGILPHGVDLKPITVNHREGQFAELADRQVGEVLRAIGVPGVVVGWMGDKTSTYASAEAFFEKGGIRHCLLPFCKNLQARAEKALLPDGDRHYIRFDFTELEQINTKDRFEANLKAAGGPWMSRNEIRGSEDFNPDPDPAMDKVLVPSNMPPAGEEPATEDRTPPPPGAAPAQKPAPDEEARQKLAAFAAHNAGEIVRREVSSVMGGSGRGAAERFAKDAEGWRAWVAKYYEEHVALVARKMQMSESLAREYCDAQAAELLAGGAKVVEGWEETVPARLAALALRKES